jgi:hypothetical protein
MALQNSSNEYFRISKIVLHNGELSMSVSVEGHKNQSTRNSPTEFDTCTLTDKGVTLTSATINSLVSAIYSELKSSAPYDSMTDV